MNIELEISQEELSKLDEMVKENGVNSYHDLINNSLSLLYWANQQIKEGKVIAAVDEKEQKYIEVQMDVLNNLKK